MRNIEIMLHDGYLGNKAMLLALSGFATGNLNAKLRQGNKAFEMKDILPSTHEYIVPPLTEEEQKVAVNNNLISFMAQAPGAEKLFGAHTQ